MILGCKYLARLYAYFCGLVSDRRFVTKTGAAGVFSIAGIGSFSDAYGLRGVVGYIAALAILRVAFAIPVSHAVKRFPEWMLKIHRWSPCLILGGALGVLSGHLWLLPLCLALYISTWWTMYHSLREIRGKTTADFVDGEVWSSVLGTILALFVTSEFSIEAAAVFGGVLCLTGALIPVDVTADELLDSLETWEEEARGRSREEIANGVRIARGIGLVSFCSLSSLRINLLDAPGEAPSEGILYLGVAIVIMELLVWIFTSKTTQGLRNFVTRRKDRGGEGREYGGRRETVLAFIITTAGFGAMMQQSELIFAVGYIIVSISLRGVYRDCDQEYARSNLRGLNGNPAARELEKFATWMFLCPILLVPWILPYVGIIGAMMLLNSSFTHPRDRGTVVDRK